MKAWLGIFILVLPCIAYAESAPLCAPVEKLDKFRFLRQLSLDLRGQPPTFAEYEAIRDKEDIDEDIIDSFLNSEQFYTTVRDFHKQRLQSTLQGINLNNPVLMLSPTRDNPQAELRLFSGLASNAYRGEGGLPCLDQPQTQFDPASGLPLPIAATYNGADQPGRFPRCEANAANCKREGYVVINPYWAPETSIRVCAWDIFGAPGVNFTPCGAGAINCISHAGAPYGNSNEIYEAATEEAARIFEYVVRERQPYQEAFKTRLSFVNGPLSHLYRVIDNLDVARAGSTLFGMGMGALPDLAPGDKDTWLPVMRGGVHSGILTTAIYMLRFNTNRSRANQFYAEFLCSPFEPPTEPPPADTDPCSREPDLSKRCGCKHCHEKLEPAASSWGRWRHSEQAGYLNNANFPVFRAECATCTDNDNINTNNCSQECQLYYMTPDNATAAGEVQWRGYLKNHAWRVAQPNPAGPDAPEIQAGPRGLVEKPGYEDKIAHCTTRRVLESMLGRTLQEEENASILAAMATEFRNKNYDFKALIKAVISDPLYRKVQ